MAAFRCKQLHRQYDGRSGALATGRGRMPANCFTAFAIDGAGWQDDMVRQRRALLPEYSEREH